MTVSKLRLTKGRLEDAIHAAAKSSSNIVFLPELERKSMAGMMSFLQAKKCLESGAIVGKPALNEHGDWLVEMQRFAANHLCRVSVIVQCDGAKVSRLIVDTGNLTGE